MYFNGQVMSAAVGVSYDAAQQAIADALAAHENNKDNPHKVTAQQVEVYPVGAIYMSVNDTDPSVFFGGVWERLKDRFLLAAGDTYAAGATGGADKVALSVDEMPRHEHAVRDSENNAGIGLHWTDNLDTASGSTKGMYAAFGTGDLLSTSKTGSSAAHENMPPYLAVYMWKRTA